MLTFIGVKIKAPVQIVTLTAQRANSLNAHQHPKRLKVIVLIQRANKINLFLSCTQ